MTSGSPALARAPRFHAVDGLRGIAAASVAMFHLHKATELVAPHWMAEWLAVLPRRGYAGVDIFFVISGFVIAFSVRDGKYSARYLGLFALRRSIRLDPPYWLAIAVQLSLVAVSMMLFPSLNTSLPSAAKVLAHLFYAQDILGYGDIVQGVFWTLCYEIQFYLLFVGLLVLWEQIKGASPWEPTVLAYTVLAGLFVTSLMVGTGGWHFYVRGLALEFWFEFFLGVLCWWFISGRVSLGTILSACGAVLIALGVYHARALPMVVAVIVSGFLIVVGRAGRLDTLNSRVLQFLGKISYSLYLFHVPFGVRWITFLERRAGSSFRVSWAYFAFISAFAISIAVATLVWRLIEVPTMRFSKRIRLPSRGDVPAAVVDVSLLTA